MPWMQRATSTAAQRIGDAGESLIAARLEAAGWTVLARNVRVGRDELDLVAIDPGPPPALVIVEVRRRSRRDFGLAEETVDHRKRTNLRRAASRLLEGGTLPDGRLLPALALRIDLVAVDVGPDGRPSVRHHRAAC
jgi:putative endonuclease